MVWKASTGQRSQQPAHILIIIHTFMMQDTIILLINERFITKRTQTPWKCSTGTKLHTTAVWLISDQFIWSYSSGLIYFIPLTCFNQDNNTRSFSFSSVSLWHWILICFVNVIHCSLFYNVMVSFQGNVCSWLLSVCLIIKSGL